MQNANSFFDLIILGLMVWFVYSRFMSNKLPKDNKKPLNTASILPFNDNNNDEPLKAQDNPISGMDELKKLDRSFKENDFINGTKQAFNMYYEALNNQDEDMLDSLIAPKLFDEVMDKVEEKMDKGIIPKTDVKDIVSVDIVDTRIQGKTAIISVKYAAKIVEYEENIKSKKVTKNIAKKEKSIQTIWTWARPIDSSDPNWELEDINALS